MGENCIQYLKAMCPYNIAYGVICSLKGENNAFTGIVLLCASHDVHYVMSLYSCFTSSPLSFLRGKEGLRWLVQNDELFHSSYCSCSHLGVPEMTEEKGGTPGC